MSFLNQKKSIDSLHREYNQTIVHEQNAQRIIDIYSKIYRNDNNFSNEDLKILAINYGRLNNPEKASGYLEKYIKSSHDINILSNAAFDTMRNVKIFDAVNRKFTFKLNIWFTSYFYFGLIGVFLAFVLNLKKSSDKISNLLIALFILLSSLFVLQECLYFTNAIYKYPYSLYWTISFNFLYGPLLFFYFKRITGKYEFKIIDVLHLLPFLICFLRFSRYFFISPDEKLQILLNRDDKLNPEIYMVILAKAISLLTYAFFVVKMYRKTKNAREGNRIIELWKRNITILFVVYVCSQLLFSALIIESLSMVILVHFQLITISIIILFVGYTAYVQPDVFSKDYLTYTRGLFVNKYKKSGLTKSLSLELKDQLLDLFYKEKIYKLAIP